MADSGVGLGTPSHGVLDSGFRSMPSQSMSYTPTLSHPSYSIPLTGSYFGPDLSPSPPEPIQVNAMGVQPALGSPDTRHRNMSTNTSPSPVLQNRLANQDNPLLDQQSSPPNGYQPGVSSSPILIRHGMVSQATQSSPMLSRQMPNSQGTQSSPTLGRQAFQSSPPMGYQPSLVQSVVQPNQSSPVLSRQPSTSQATQSSPVLSRQASLTHPGQGSPILGRHPSMSQVSHGSPSLDRHPMYSGYTTPDERHGALSRQSSSSGYHPPSTPSFPVSPAGYPDSLAFRQGSPGLQPQLPEKRRMSSGERPNGSLSYGTLNGKVSSPMSSGGSTPSVHFFHTLPDFSKLNMCGK